MSWRAFGPEWHPVLIVLAVLAVGIGFALLHWYLGLAFVAACLIAFVIAVSP